MRKKQAPLIMKVTLISLYLTMFLRLSLASNQASRFQGQTREQQEVERVGKNNDELNQALITAVNNGRADEVSRLLSQGADVNNLPPDLLHDVCIMGFKDIAELLIQKGAGSTFFQGTGEVMVPFLIPYSDRCFGETIQDEIFLCPEPIQFHHSPCLAGGCNPGLFNKRH